MEQLSSAPLHHLNPFNTVLSTISLHAMNRSTFSLRTKDLKLVPNKMKCPVHTGPVKIRFQILLIPVEQATCSNGSFRTSGRRQRSWSFVHRQGKLLMQLSPVGKASDALVEAPDGTRRLHLVFDRYRLVHTVEPNFESLLHMKIQPSYGPSP